MLTNINFRRQVTYNISHERQSKSQHLYVRMYKSAKHNPDLFTGLFIAASRSDHINNLLRTRQILQVINEV